MDLQPYLFPVEERQIAIDDARHPTIDLDDDGTHLSVSYKAIVRADTNEPIFVVRSTYQIVTNQQLINELLYQLVQLDTRFELDQSHSFAQNNRMFISWSKS